MIRGVLGALGIVAGGYGVWLLADRGWSNAVAAGWWLAGGVVAHDAVLAPATIVVGLVLLRVVPAAWRGAVVAGGVVAATVTLAVVPTIGRFGARPDNPTLLDRNYLVGWLVFVALVSATAVLGSLWHARRTAGGGGADGADPGR